MVKKVKKDETHSDLILFIRIIIIQGSMFLLAFLFFIKILMIVDSTGILLFALGLVWIMLTIDKMFRHDKNSIFYRGGS